MKSSELLFEIPFGSRTVTCSFDGGCLSSDAGMLLLREVDRKLGLTRRLAGCIRDCRDGSKVRLSVEEMLRQRVFGIALGYEDCNDHDCLKSDPMLKLSVGRDPISGEDLASQPGRVREEASWRAYQAIGYRRGCD
jgi:hypothetical protein